VWLVEGPHPPGGSRAHGNARTTVHGRKLIAVRHRAGWKQAHIAAAMGVSRKCVRTWITRFEGKGEAGLVDDVEDLGTAEAGDLYGSHAGGLQGLSGARATVCGPSGTLQLSPPASVVGTRSVSR
jgi:hypothetical protein